MEGIVLTNQLLDKAIFAMAERAAGTYPVNKRQAEVLKAAWDGLHLYDKEHYYTFNSDFTQIIKRQKL